MISGVIEKTIYQDLKTGYGHFSFRIGDKIISAKGYLPILTPFAPLSLEGNWQNKEFLFSKASFYSSNLGEIKVFLQNMNSKKQPSIMEALSFAGLVFFDKIENLEDFPLTLKENRTFLRSVSQILEWKKIMEWQSVYPGFPLSFFHTLIKKYTLKKAEDTFYQNIFQVGMDAGLSFFQCDRIAKRQKKSPYEADRILGGYRYVMNMVIANGNTFAFLDDFLLMLQKILGEPKISVSYLFTLKPKTMLVDFEKERPIIYDNKYLSAEKSIARNIVRLNLAEREDFKNEYFEEAQKECNIVCGKEQREAICDMSRKRGVKILTGNPGTGKTTSIDVFIHVYKKMHPDHIITLCAPTGRAAQRMQESTGYSASTIHHLLQYYTSGDRNLCKNENDPILTNLLIVDEMSMVDVELFDLLLRAVKNNTCVVLVGDPYQLHSVGPGQVLLDLIESGLIDHYHLTEVFRQKQESLIINNAYKVNNGIDALESGQDFKIFYMDSEEEMVQFALDMVDLYDDIQIMNPVKRGISGVFEMNQQIQKNTPHQQGPFIQYGMNRFHVGDKIIMTSNCSEMNFYNGDLGEIVKIEDGVITASFPNKTLSITQEYFSEMDLAYSITIHKSQGSEFPTVLIMLPFHPRSKTLLIRNLLYTAITRCKKKAIILAQKGEDSDALQYCIKNLPQKRRGRLLECLKETKNTMQA